MRRKRSDNKREIARRRASAARGGLQETGAVSASLLETEDRLQTEVDDIWNRAAAGASHLEGQANIDNWSGDQAKIAGDYGAWSSGLSGASNAAGQLKDVYDAKKAPKPKG